MTHRLRSDSGQALVVMVVFMLCLLGGVALTLDVGSWYREHRQAQTTADAAALAAAQFLPNTVTAKSTAQTYADKNGGSLDPRASSNGDRSRASPDPRMDRLHSLFAAGK